MRMIIFVLLFSFTLLASDIEKDISNYIQYRIESFFNKTRFKNSTSIIVALAALESGWFKSEKHQIFENYFSIKDWKHPKCKTRPIYCMKQFASLDENLEFMRQYFIRKKFPTSNQQEFLDHLEKIKYSQDPEHRNKVEKIAKNIVLLTQE